MLASINKLPLTASKRTDFDLEGHLLGVYGIKRTVEEPCLETAGIRKSSGQRLGVFYQDFSPPPFKILSDSAADEAEGSLGAGHSSCAHHLAGGSLTH